MSGFATSMLLLADDGHGWGHMGDWGWMWLWGAVAMTFWIVLLGGVVWLLVRGRGEPARGEPGRDAHGRAREILAERYARGELETQEYHERLEGLR